MAEMGVWIERSPLCLPRQLCAPFSVVEQLFRMSRTRTSFFLAEDHWQPLVGRVGHADNHPVDKSGIAVDIDGEAIYPETLLPN